MRAVVCNDGCKLAVSEAGQLFAWGRQLQPPLPGSIAGRKWQAPVPTIMEKLRNHRVCQVAAGRSHCAAVTEDGALFTWQTKRESSFNIDAVPSTPVSALGYGGYVAEFGVPHRVFPLEGVRIASVAVGFKFTLAVTEAGAVYSFGEGDGRHGHGKGDREVGVFLPKRIEALDGIHVATVAAGDLHALALTRCGRVYTWRAMDRHSIAHAVLGPGDDSSDGEEEDEEEYAIPHLKTALLSERVRAIAAGPLMSCAVTEAGALYIWCASSYRNVGDRGEPRIVQHGLSGIRLVGVSAGAKHGLALASDGSGYAFGVGMGLGLSWGGGEEEGEAPRRPEKIRHLVCMVPPQLAF
jgi:alpha-tubulin suppressor-like RCC1 family protein